MTTGTQRISFAGQPLCIEGDAMLVSGIQFAASKHELRLLQQNRKCLVKMEQIRFIELTCYAGAVRQVM